MYVITEKNYSQYIAIPEYILKKLDEKKIGLAHFADYLRVCLLEKHGGLWLDATIFCSNAVPEDYFDLPFFTCKSELRTGSYLSNFQWTTFCLGGWRHHPFYQLMKDALELYWLINDTAIDYLFFDYLIYLAKENNSFIKEALEKVPINNVHRDDLQAAMNENLPATEFQNVIKEDTVLYKLSWRETYLTHSTDKKETVYGYFIRMVI